MNAETPAAEGETPGQIDAGLIAQTLAGHDPAFDELVRRYHRQALAVAYRLLHNAEDAADVAQDAFLRAYRGLASLKDRQRFGAWLMRIVTNLALNYRRGRKNAPTASFEDLGDAAGEFRGAGGQPLVREPAAESGPLSSELRAAITRAIDDLPEKQRLTLLLFTVEGMPQKDVADVVGCSVELVKWNVFQARKKLKQVLADYM